MSYCMIADITLRTGTTLADEIVQALIDDADAKIDAYLLPHGLGGTASGAVKIASIELVKAGLLDRSRQDGTRPDASSEGDVSETVNIEAAIARHTAEAFRNLDLFIASKATHRRFYVAKVMGR